jgi:hypothetical protein
MGRSKLKKDVLLNIAFAGLNLLALMWVVRVAGIVFSPFALGYFLLSRRISGAGGTLLQLGSSKTLLRYIPINIQDAYTKRNFVVFAGLMWVILSVIFVPIFYLFRDFWAQWLFSEGGVYESIAFWSGILMLATVGSYIAYDILLAERRMVIANIVGLINAAGLVLLPLFLLSSTNQDPQGVVQVLWFQSVGIIILSCLVIFIYLKGLGVPFLPNLLELKATAQVYRDYGLIRTISPFLENLVLLIGPWLLRDKIEEAGFLIIALTLVRAIQLAIKPIVQVASISAARVIGQDRDDLMREGVRLVFGTSLYIAVFSIVIILPWSYYLIRLWLVDVRIVQGVLPYFNALLWGLLPFAIYHSLKGIIEVRWVRPFNLVTLTGGTIVQFLVYKMCVGTWGPYVAICLSLLAGFWLMGILSVFWLRAYLQPIRYLGIDRLAVLATILAVLNLWSASQPLWFGLMVSGISTVLVIALVLFVIPTPIIYSLRKFVLG